MVLPMIIPIFLPQQFAFNGALYSRNTVVIFPALTVTPFGEEGTSSIINFVLIIIDVRDEHDSDCMICSCFVPFGEESRKE